MVTRRHVLSTIPGLATLGSLTGGRLHAADLPRPTPAMVFKKPEGGVIDPKQFLGKVVALEFMITTCPHCQRCSQILQKMQNEYGDKGFQALGVATNDMAHMLVPDFKKNYGIHFPMGWAPRDDAHSFLQHPAMLIMYVPQLVFIDRKGVIRAQFAGNDDFFRDEERNVRNQITSLLNEKTAAPARSRKAVKSGTRG
ncbi:MAG: TlpA disulfide reductase family protein [Bryobacteraceae bacterium]